MAHEASTVPDAAPEGRLASGVLTAAQLMEKHAATLPHAAAGAEDAADEADANPAASSAEGSAVPEEAAPAKAPAAAKSKPAPKKAAALDLASAEAFPTLGGPAPIKPIATPVWSHRPTTVPAITNGHSIPVVPESTSNGTSTPVPGSKQGGIESTNILELRAADLTPRQQLKRAPADVGRDVEKKTHTRIQMSTTAAGVMVVIIKGLPHNIQGARRELCRELCMKKVLNVVVPTFVRPHIIGKGGENIKKLQNESGTKITVPKQAEGEQQVHEDDGTTVTVVIEGDVEGTELAKSKIDKIVADKTAQIIVRLTEIHGKFYPFIAGPHFKNINALQKGKDLQITVPEEHFTETGEPGASTGPIVLKGDKFAVNEAKEAIEKIVHELGEHFTVFPADLPVHCHRPVYGDRGKGIHDILEETGCQITLPHPSKKISKCIISGPRDKIGPGVTKVLSISGTYHHKSMTINGAYKNSPLGADVHARGVARFLKKSQALKGIEGGTTAQLSQPEIPATDSPLTYQIVATSQSDLATASQKFKELVERYPAGRVRRLNIDPLCHQTIIGKGQKGISQTLEKYGVHIIMGEDPIYGDEVFLIYEGRGSEPTPAEEIEAKLNEVEGSLEEQAARIGNIDEEIIFIRKELLPVIQGGTTFNALSQGSVIISHSLVEAKGEQPERISVRIRGASVESSTSSDVKATAKKILAWADSLKDVEDLTKPFIHSFDYPSQFSAMLIGKSGSNVNKLRDDLGVDIRLKEGKGEIKGVQVNVEIAKKRLLEQIKQFEDNTVVKVKAPQEYHRTIIGAAGRFVRRLEEKYNVRINFPKSRDDDAKSDAGSDVDPASTKPQVLASDEILIKGPRKGVSDAKAEIEELLKYEISNSQTANLTISVKHLKPFYGIYGKEVRRIREEGGVRVDVGNDSGLPPDATVEVKIKGTKEAVAAAKKDLSKIIKDIEQLTVRKIEVDKKYHRALIGTGGATLREIVEKAGGPTDRHAQARMVHFPTIESTDNVITLEGNAAVVEKIAEAINKIVSEKQSQVQAVVDVPADKHWKLIGRGGSVRQELEGRFKVNIDVPRQNPAGPSPTGVTITGLPADVEAAKAHIINFTKEAIGETVYVPEYLHHAVADGGLFIQRLRNELRVKVEHNNLPHPQKPAPAQRPDSLITDTDEERNISWVVVDGAPAGEEVAAEFPWVLRGPNAEAVAKAQDLLTKQIDLVKNQTSTGFLVLPDPSKHRLIVGQAGARVNKIREDTGCRIMIPKDKSDGDAIVMHGSTEGLEKAKKIILDILATHENRNDAGGNNKDNNAGNGGRRNGGNNRGGNRERD
ncbi:hypothetical protein DFH27DRAFT_545989 [Peziza echinospora]|nr:hypothetical protein DFH27DRAFT_545989 [Peziza echinospora]